MLIKNACSQKLCNIAPGFREQFFLPVWTLFGSYTA